MGTYITLTGFVKKTLAEIKTELEISFQDVFGDDIVLSSDQPFGQVIGIIAKNYADGWDVLEEIYTARNPQESIGTSLDNIVAENGITRLPATKTTISNVILYGDDGTVIATGKKAKQASFAIEYELDTGITIQKSNARYAAISVKTLLDSTLYTVTIDGNPYTFTSDSTATNLEILNGLKSDIDAGAFAGTTSVDTINELLEINNESDFALLVDVNLDIDEVGGAGDFTAVSTGSNVLSANSLNTIVTPVTGWNSINNPSLGITGRDTESDSELRLRREQAVNGVGNATEESIRSKIIDEVDNITGCTVYSNRTDYTDNEDRPPHSFEAVVQGGDDDEIAEKLWETMSAGIESIGNINADGSANPTIPGTGIAIIDSQGFTQTILYSRPENIYIWVKVKRDKYDEEIYPTDGDALIKDKILEWSLEISNIDVGKDVIRQRLSTPVYNVPGIEDIEIQLDSTSSPSGSPAYTEQNIAVGDRQIAVFAISRIVVEDLTP